MRGTRPGVQFGSRAPWHALLAAAYPVLFLWSQNVGEAAAGEVLPVLLLAVGVAAGALAILTVLLRDARRAALVVTPIVLGLLMYGHVANLLEPIRAARPIVQQLGWVTLAVIGLVAAVRLPARALDRVTRGLNGIGAVLVIVTLVVIVPAQLTQARTAPAAPPVARGITAVPSDRPLRDVYYIVLDRYGSDDALDRRFGIRNDLTPWLAQQGFRVLPDSRANYFKTVLSLASTLNMTHLDELAARMGPTSGDHQPVFDMLQDTRVGEQFRALGYEYVHIGSYYSPTRRDVGADVNLATGGGSDFADAVYDASAIQPLLQRLSLAPRVSASSLRHHEAALFQLDALDTVLEREGPTFLMAHVMLPHPPYTFEADGSLPDGRTRSEDDRFAGQLAWTNTRLRAWVERALAVPEDEQPIIILQADEGPYPVRAMPYRNGFDWTTATDDELLQKFGILNAWYVPGGTDIGLRDDQTSVNTFPTLFAGYFGLDVPALPDRVRTSRTFGRPYDFVDITERLSAAR